MSFWPRPIRRLPTRSLSKKASWILSGSCMFGTRHRIFQRIEIQTLILCRHTSGSTGLPKPLTWNQDAAARHHACTSRSGNALEGAISVDSLLIGKRIIVTVPPFHVSQAPKKGLSSKWPLNRFIGSWSQPVSFLGHSVRERSHSASGSKYCYRPRSRGLTEANFCGSCNPRPVGGR